ncbi:hypothetical protein PRZ48_009026 [Zasmidium cellare]|uniref:Heterokaryon incompatibility domain-containing protein n=1 Tax=Zasmidium cellare TaxID=395010 RepID=A0ABR0EHJ2_ZASCE|nr:hypothetical protein PRZ48_009026 [Zasmidium cellare]
MRLINVHTLDTKDFSASWPEYAILSHRWEDEEISYQDYQDPAKRVGPGYRKIADFCLLVQQADWAKGQATRRGIHWAWVDTCCIDKTSSAELSEAINSMWTWYQEAAVCVAYISDCEVSDSRARTLRSLRASPWFRRGWTLQELLAPKEVFVYAQNWQCLGQRNTTADLRRAINLATAIEEGYLQGRKHVADASIAQRMSWASARKTTRGEDLAYCLMGIFNVNMPLLYGEGQEKAFYRLQEEIVKQSNDESIFAFGLNMYGKQPALAANPRQFVDCEHVRTARRLRREPYTITNTGLNFESPAIKWTLGRDCFYILNLNCGRLVFPEGGPPDAHPADAVRLKGCIMVLRKMGDRFVRDFSWEKKVEELSPIAAEHLAQEGLWQKIDSMRFYLAVTVNDVYSAEVDERQNALNIRDGQSFWYEDNDGPMFGGFTVHEGVQRAPTGKLMASELRADEFDEDHDRERWFELEATEVSPLAPQENESSTTLGPFELEA